MSVENRLLFILLLMAASIGISGCDNSFEGLSENDRYHFSIFGALDFSADTQWVRVMPITDSLFINSTAPIDATVTLSRNSTGEINTLNDSLLQYSDQVKAWNFWTDIPIHDNEEYTLTAESSDGRSSSATVVIPPDFPMPEAIYSEESESGRVFGTGVERLVVADIFYTVSISNICEPGSPPTWVVTISHIERTEFSDNGGFQFYPDDVNEIARHFNATSACYRVNIFKREALVVSGSPQWPEYENLSEDEIMFSETSSNVEDGLGVLAGIVSKRFPLKSCFDENDELIACPPVE